ncbi:siderophore-interacting protein [soil metagenome]
MDSIETTRRVQRVRHELKRRQLTVLRVEALGPHLRRIVFGSEALADFVSMSFDDHVKMFFPLPDGSAVGRDYTPRRFDIAARELTVDFCLHGEGPASTWAELAEPGTLLDIGGPKGSIVIPMDYDWHLLIGDETALPAIGRRLEELAGDAHVIVLAQVADPADRPALAVHEHVELRWFDDRASLVDAVRNLGLPAGDGYAWCAGESVATATIRSLLVDGKGHDRHAIRASAYWKLGASGHHENFE